MDLGGRMTVHSPKTEHHEGKRARVIPIFPELRPYLEDAKVRPSRRPNTSLAVTERNANLRTQLERIIRKAGLKPWPKLFQNLRSTRENGTAETFPIHVVCQWIGNSKAIATKHYLQTTDEHYSKASRTSRCSQERTRPDQRVLKKLPKRKSALQSPLVSN